jgi:hypothetical protein
MEAEVSVEEICSVFLKKLEKNWKGNTIYCEGWRLSGDRLEDLPGTPIFNHTLSLSLIKNWRVGLFKILKTRFIK